MIGGVFLIVLGLTGGICSGASTVARMLGQKGFAVVDADAISHDLLGQKAVRQKILRSFGKKIARKSRGICRIALGRLVFSDRKSLVRLNKIMHPLILGEISRQLARHKKAGTRLVVLDAPLLVETGLQKKIDFLAVVRASVKKRIARLQKRDGLSAKEALKRINAQIPLEKKLALADFVVDNNRALSKTRAQAQALSLELEKIVKKNGANRNLCRHF